MQKEDGAPSILTQNLLFSIVILPLSNPRAGKPACSRQSGTQLLRETWGNNWIEYFYDENGSPTYCLRYDENDGDILLNFYITNLQGDVIAVCDNTHVPRFFYHYDAWGKLLSVTNANGEDVTGVSNAASWNILRYRGYIYDQETGLYYVSSRYYDPEICRWINADSQLNTSLGILGLNRITYCLNNPVNMTDYVGNKPGDLFNTMDEAARDFAEYINGTSIENNREYASYIYSKTVWKTKTVTYYNPNAFGKNLFSHFFNYLFGGGITKTVKKRVKVTKYTYVTPSKGTKDSSMIPVNWFGLHNQVALLHTHAAYDPKYSNDIFSQTDKNLAKRRGIPTYVATPIGTLRRYNPSNGTDIILFGDIPFDPNHPGRK